MCCIVKGVLKLIFRIVCSCLIIASVVGAVLVFVKQRKTTWSDLAHKYEPAFVLVLAVMALAIVSAVIGLVLSCIPCGCIYCVYIIILVICIIAEIVCFALSFATEKKTVDKIQENWVLADKRDVRKKLEKEEKCCGFKTLQLIDCGYDDVTDLTKPTCENKVKDLVKKSYTDLKIVSVIILAVEIVLLILAILLKCFSKSVVGAKSELESD